jgi:hypothetical protein
MRRAITRPCRKAATIAMARWVILSLQPLLSQDPSLYWARRRATLARSYLLTKRHVLCCNVRQATRYCFVKDACLLPQNAAIICKLVFFWRVSMLYSNVCAFCRLFALLMEFLHSAGDLSVSACCSLLCVHRLLICNFVTDISQRLVAPSFTFGCYASPQVARYDVPTVFQARKIRAYHKIRHTLATSTLVWHTQSQFLNLLFQLTRATPLYSVSRDIPWQLLKYTLYLIFVFPCIASQARRGAGKLTRALTCIICMYIICRSWGWMCITSETCRAESVIK